jgi:hypothetical protein
MAYWALSCGVCLQQARYVCLAVQVESGATGAGQGGQAGSGSGSGSDGDRQRQLQTVWSELRGELVGGDGA